VRGCPAPGAFTMRPKSTGKFCPLVIEIEGA
jgi:hypothetical protein